MKTIVFDFDGTLTQKSHEIWTKMWEIIDALDVDYEIYCKYRDKEIDYIKWCELIEIEYKKRGFSKEMLFKVAQGMELMENLEETLKTLKDNGYALYIISGGVEAVVRDKLGDLVKYFDGIYACGFEFDENGLLTHIVPTRYDDEGKKLFIDEYCSTTGTNPTEITFIGNGDNDEYVYLSGCHTICLNPGKRTRFENSTIWHSVIDGTTNMLDILGYLEINK
ncbi:MAG: HAD-IB family phosphatase [Bacilli bacterium]|nr:HAD-IB family phosphatase [Bacilli bacterium]